MIFIDQIETLPDINDNQTNLNLTYAVRDGIISHCGEVDENGIRPREEVINLDNYLVPNQFSPFTWEGCVVKISDKISYLGRDIEDAVLLDVLSTKEIRELRRILSKNKKLKLKGSLKEINNTVLINKFITDLCENSSIKKGLCFSDEYYNLIKIIKQFNYDKIYNNVRLKHFKEYANLVLNTIYNFLINIFDNYDFYKKNIFKKLFPNLYLTFYDWLIKYSNLDGNERKKRKYYNDIIFNSKKKEEYLKAVLYYISGMTDKYAIKCFEEIIKL